MSEAMVLLKDRFTTSNLKPCEDRKGNSLSRNGQDIVKLLYLILSGEKTNKKKKMRLTFPFFFTSQSSIMVSHGLFSFEQIQCNTQCPNCSIHHLGIK